MVREFLMEIRTRVWRNVPMGESMKNKYFCVALVVSEPCNYEALNLMKSATMIIAIGNFGNRTRH
jgi:hypothetical protein